MLSEVVVHEPGGFEKWLASASNFVDRLPPAEAGQRLYETRGCASCHSVDGKAGIGPTFKGLFGSSVPLSDGRRVTADEDYVRESILEPMAKIVVGIRPGDADLQGEDQGQGDHGHHRVPEDRAVAQPPPAGVPRPGIAGRGEGHRSP